MTKEIMMARLTLDRMRFFSNEKTKIEKKKFKQSLNFNSCYYCERISNGE